MGSIEIVTETRLRIGGTQCSLDELREFMRNCDEVEGTAAVVFHQTQAHPMERGQGSTTITVKGANR